MPGHRSPLSITPDQTEFTERQLAALIARGMPEDPPEPWLALFLHYIHTLDLDPLQGQLRLLRRSEPEINADGQRVVATQWSVETSIQGFRIGARRAAKRAGIRLHRSEKRWYDDRTGTWLEAWPYPQPPTAARFVLVAIDRDGEKEEVVGVVHHSEYAKTSVDGIAIYGWARMPSHMLAKCAEVDAFRQLFPEELGGLNLAGLSPDTDTESRTRRTLTTSPPNTEAAIPGPHASPSGLLSTPRRAPSAPPAPPHPPAETADTPPAPAEPTIAAPGVAAAADTEAPRPSAPARRPRGSRRPASATVADAAVQEWLSEATEKLTNEAGGVLAWAADRLNRPLADIGAITADDLSVLKAALAATDIGDSKD